MGLSGTRRFGPRMLRYGTVLAAAVTFVAAAPTLDAAPAPAGGSGVWVEAAFAPPEVPVGAQAVYTLSVSQAIDVRDLDLEVPAPALATLRPLGDARVFEATRDGRRVRVTERRFAVFPFASGPLVMSGAHISGLVPARDGSGARAPLRVDAPDVPLSVLPIPAAAANSPWRPARAVSVSEEWAPGGREVRLGDALERTIRIEARGVDAVALEVPAFAVEGASVHAAPPRRANRSDGDWNVAVLEQTSRVVPQRAGTLVVPELRLDWWDSLASRARVATLPSRTLLVAGDAAAEPPAPEPRSTADEAPAPPVTRAAVPRSDFGRTTLGLAAATLTLGVGLLLWRAKGPASARALRDACRNEDPHAARDAMLSLARTQRGARPPRSLGELAERLADPLCRDAVRALDRHLYGPRGQDWDPRAMLALVPALTPKRFGKGRRAPVLPPLGDL